MVDIMISISPYGKEFVDVPPSFFRLFRHFDHGSGCLPTRGACRQIGARDAETACGADRA
jgi:hypothetical protein